MRILTLAGGLLCLALPAFCQGEDFAQILSRFDRNCSRLSTINYRSPEVVQPRSGKVFFISGTLQRRPRQESVLIGSSCFPVKAETPKVSLVFLDQKINSIPLHRHRSTISFNYVKPVAFSPNGRFLVLQVNSSNGVDLQSSLDVIDTERGYLPLHLDICPDATFGSVFLDFLDNDRAKFKCISGDRNNQEVWDLRRSSKINVNIGEIKS